MKFPFFYSLPPAGNKIPLKTILGAVRASRRGDTDTLLDPIKDYLGTPNLLYLSSGRTSLQLILKTLATLRPDRTEVVIPVYTCPAVASAVLKAGFKPVLCDNNWVDFGLSGGELAGKINKKTLAVVLVHLFGYPANIFEVQKICREAGVFLVEDAAQAFGHCFPDSNEAKLGLRGDAGFFSFGRGKPISLLHGGIAVFKSPDLFHEAQLIYQGLAKFDGLRNIDYGLSLVGYSFLSNPRLYWIPQGLPFLHLGETHFEPEFDTFQGSSLGTSLVSDLLKTSENEKEIRSRNSEWYANQVTRRTMEHTPRCAAFPYLRYPLLLRDKATRDQVYKRMRSQGCGAALFYPGTLNQLPGLQERLNDPEDYEKGSALAERLLTLPVHSGVRESDLEKIISIVNSAD